LIQCIYNTIIIHYYYALHVYRVTKCTTLRSLRSIHYLICGMCSFSFAAKMIGLPQIFWHEHGIGGGVIQVRRCCS